MNVALKVLIIEDEHDIAANIWDFLERRGCVVDHVANGERGLERAMAAPFDVIILDLGLPGLDGLDLCRRLREARRSVPVLMLTARDTLVDCLRGFEHGADDYLVKPFAMRELEVRIRALHRRQMPLLDARLQLGDLSYSPRSMLAERDGRSIALTVAQGRILAVLMRESPSVIRREALAFLLWGEEGGSFAALHTHVCALRALIDRPFGSELLQTVHGVGYRLVADR
ncbi:MAG: response regulator transcription factor [Dokdonella sp.]